MTAQNPYADVTSDAKVDMTAGELEKLRRAAWELGYAAGRADEAESTRTSIKDFAVPLLMGLADKAQGLLNGKKS